LIFVNSMSDLFHKEVPHSHIDRVFDTMEKADWHVFQVLTKRSSLMRDYINRRYSGGLVPEHIWLGVSVEDSKRRSRITHLRQAAVSIRFLSIEPMIGDPGDLNLADISWVIAGGESGPGARPMKEEWVTSVRDQCVDQDVPFFFKQWGGFRPKSGGRLLEGSEWNEFPRLSSRSGDPRKMYREAAE
jgi:protein gp37